MQSGYRGGRTKLFHNKIEKMSNIETKSIPNEEFIPQIWALIKEGKDVTILVRGNSMNPAIVDKRDHIVLSPFEDRDIKRGAFIMALTKEMGYVAHRVIKREGDLLSLRGDGNSRGVVEHSSIDKVVGLVTVLIKKGKNISTTSKRWRIYSVAWMTLFPVRRYILWIWRRLNNNKKQR